MAIEDGDFDRATEIVSDAAEHYIEAVAWSDEHADDREPETGATARASGEGKRFEDTFALIGGNTRPVIAHRTWSGRSRCA